MAHASMLTDILRILTPEEIAELTTESTGHSRVELTEMLDMIEAGEEVSFVEDDEGAKILPFREGVEESETQAATWTQAGSKVVEYISHYIKKSSLGETAKNESGESVETSVFILKEKERFKYVQGKLKQKEVMSLYMKNANVDIEQEKTLKDDLSKSSRSGVLVNKKQF